MCQAQQSKAAAVDGRYQLVITADESMILAAAAELPSEDTIAVRANQDYRSGIPTAEAEDAEALASSSLRDLLLVFSSTGFPTTD